MDNNTVLLLIIAEIFKMDNFNTLLSNVVQAYFGEVCNIFLITIYDK